MLAAVAYVLRFARPSGPLPELRYPGDCPYTKGDELEDGGERWVVTGVDVDADGISVVWCEPAPPDETAA
jgi:hypothetical protein